MNWDWFFFWRKKLPPPIHELPAPQPAAVDTTPLNDVFLEAIQESYDEQYKAELELLNDSKLREYVKNAVKEVNKDITGESYSFIHLYPHEVGISDKAWMPFAKILIELFKTIGVHAENKGGHLYLDKKEVIEAFSNLKRNVIDIDERTRAMLSQGIYR